MKNLSLFVLFVLFLTENIFSQNASSDILMTIHDRQISLEEFERIYKKNNSNTALEQQSVEEYLELFINFKLKVIEAEEQGMDTSQAFLREFNGYKKQLAKPYLSDKEEQEALIKEAFERAQKDIHASHILIRMDEYASPEDTLKTYEKVIEIRERILAGEDFATVARASSDDPSAKTNSGDLGYFTVFRMIYPFETAAYNTGIGKISLPVRSRFGYHLIKVHDIRQSRGEVQVSHIMILTPESMPDQDKKLAEEKIQTLYDSLEMGMDFAELATVYSEDRGSAARGGELAWFGTGRMVPEFEVAAFALKSPGDISKPIKTDFGWHILKLLDKKTYEDYDKMKAELQTNVNKSDRSQYSKKSLVGKLKAEYGYEEYPGNLTTLYSLVDSSIFMRKWDASIAGKLMDPVLKIGGRGLTVSDFSNFLGERQGGRPINIEVYVNTKFQEFSDEAVLQYEEDQLPDKYPDYRNLLQEYHDGILLFDLTDRMVWSKAVKDSSGLENFFSNNRDNYQWEKRLDATLFTCRDKEVAEYARSLFSTSKRKKLTDEALLSKVIKEFADSSAISIESGKFEKGDNLMVDKMDWDTDLSDNMEKDGKIVFIRRNKIIKPASKELDDARGLVTADYQNQLEKEWIAELRAKYPVAVNQEMLTKVDQN